MIEPPPVIIGTEEVIGKKPNHQIECLVSKKRAMNYLRSCGLKLAKNLDGDRSKRKEQGGLSVVTSLGGQETEGG